MAILTNESTLKLKQQLQEIDDELRRLAPGVMAQKDVIESILKSREEEKGPFADFKTAAEAVDLLFKMYGDFKLTKKEALKTMLDGGYVGKNPKAARGLLNDRLNFLLESDVLAIKGDLIGHPPKKTGKPAVTR